jgi:DNA repair exonuclease SbcCD nuclease subunit
MKNKEILVIGDIHLGVNKNNPEFFQSALKYADWIASVCQENNIKTIIQLGDIFHNREMVHVPTLNCAFSFFEKLKEFDIHIVVGNHDSMLNNTSDVNSLKLLSQWPNITIHEKVSIVDNLCFCGWGTTLNDIPDNQDVIFGHFDIKGFEMNAYKISEHGFSGSDLMRKCKILMSGHYHKPQVRIYDKKPLVYTGSVYQLNWGESGEDKFIYILNTKTLSYKPIKNEVSPRFEFIRSEQDFDKAPNNFVSVDVDKVEDVVSTVAKFKSLNARDVRTTLKSPVNKKTVLAEDGTETVEIDSNSSVDECIDEYIILLENITEEERKIVAQKLKDIYNRCI